MWITHSRPGYFGRRRDSKIAQFDETFGKGNWRLVWQFEEEFLSFEEACQRCYEESYWLHLRELPNAIDFICSFGECMDNAITNIDSGCDYTKQEAFSTHIQDIAVRNVLRRLNRSFQGQKNNILVIRGPDSNGFRFNPGNIPFMSQNEIKQPSLCPQWGTAGSVEDFWQSNKYLQYCIYE